MVSVFLIIGPARIRPSLLATVLVAPLTFLLLGTLPVVLQFGGDGWGVGPLRLTQEGLTTAAGLFVHGIAGTLAIMVLATTTPMIDVLTWLRGLHLPDPLLEIASLTYRLLFLLLAATIAVRGAQHARLGDEATFRRRWATVASTTGSIILRTWDRAARLQRGLEGRGYEDSLVTLAPVRRRSWSFVGMTAAGVSGVWLLCWAAA
nr:cobalt ECF transporter T component CbiQ [Tessaracoccus coleopterorum]